MVDLEDVVWKDVVGHESRFRISSNGELFSKHSSRILKKYINKKGYCILATRISGINKTFRLHRVVAEAFIDNPEGKPVVNHIDGCKHNNHVSNLEWCTHSENNIHALETGLASVDHLLKLNKLNRKLRDDEIRAIRDSYKPFDREFGSRALAREYGVAKSTILSIVNRERYIGVT